MTAENKKAYLEELAANFIVEASAGTGKTRSILDRVEFLIERDKSFEMGRLAAITFTEKAASELRNKLRRRLETKAGQSSAAERERLSRLLSEFDQAQVSTIHSFCSHLLRLRPVEAGVSPAFKVADEAEAAALFDKVWEKWLETTLSQNPGFFATARFMEIPIDKLKALAAALYANRDLVKPAEPAPEKEFKALLKEANNAFLQLHDRALNQAGNIKVLAGFMQNMKALLASQPDQPEAVWCKLDYSKVRDSEWSSSEAARAVRDELDRWFQKIRAQFLARLLKELVNFIARFDREKQRLELLDFQDLLLRGRDLVRKKEPREYFKRRFKYLLVDEFQDTDPVQVEMVFLLAEQTGEFAREWDKAQLEPGKLFLVGDPKQSIYRFRRADLEIYDLAKDMLLRNSAAARKEILEKNYRSHPGILEWVNLAFENLISKRPGFQPEYQELVSGEPGAKLQPPFKKPVILLELEKDPSLPAKKTRYGVDNVRAVEAKAVADFIQWSVDNKLQVWEGDKSHYRPAQYRDFAVLYSRHKHIQVLREELAARDIPFQTESREFLQRDEIAGLRAIFSAIANPLDPVAAVASLRSLFLAVSDLELLEFVRGQGTWDWLNSSPAPEKHPAIAAAYQLLRELHDQRDCKPLAAMIERLTLGAKIRQLKPLHPRLNLALLNLERVKTAARAFDAEPGASIADFVAWLDNLETHEDSTWPELMAKKANDAVSFLTYFKSKGLEFPVVILANLSNALKASPRDYELVKNWRKGEMAVKLAGYRTLNFDEMKESEDLHLDCQENRSLYVAATRARQYLVIPDHRAIDKFNGQYLERLCAALPGTGGNGASRFMESKWASDFKLEPKEQAKSALEAFASLKPCETGIEKGRKEFEKKLAEKIQEARKYVELGAPSEQAVFEARPGSTEAGRAQALAIGTIVHRVIELAGRKDLAFAKKLAQRLARESGTEDSLEKIIPLLETFWKSEFKQKIDSGQAFQEARFLIDYQGKIYRGQVDLITRGQDGLHLIDFKTDNISPDQVDAESARYARQMEVYSQALSRIAGQKLADSSVFFLKPNIQKVLK